MLAARLSHDPLTDLALLGTGRGGAPPEVPEALDLPLDPDLSPERRLLLLAGARALTRSAGRLPDRLGDLDPAPTEPRASCSLAAGRLLIAVLADERGELLPEAVQRLIEGGRVLHPVALPAALGATRPETRSLLRPVLGARGRWLAERNPGWSWVLAEHPDPARDWEEGTPEARIAALRACRAAEPERGRRWVEASWAAERPDVRFELLEALAVGSSLEDEPFLESVLDDRSAGVRHQAAELLSRLPGSALARRMRERADALVDLPPPGLLPRLRRASLSRAWGLVSPHAPARLQVRLPTRFDPAWARDGVAERLPAGGGERAWWAAQILGAVPADHWCQRFGLDRDALIAALPPEPVLLEGLTRASRRDDGAAWRAALWRAWGALGAAEPGRRSLTAERQDELAALLPPADAEILVIAALTGPPVPRARLSRASRAAASPEPEPPSAERVQRVLIALPRPWGARLSRAWVAWLRDTVARERYEAAQPWLGAVMLAGRALAPEVLPEVLALPPPTASGWIRAQWAREIERLQELARTRAALLEALG